MASRRCRGAELNCAQRGQLECLIIPAPAAELHNSRPPLAPRSPAPLDHTHRLSRPPRFLPFTLQIFIDETSVTRKATLSRYRRRVRRAPIIGRRGRHLGSRSSRAKFDELRSKGPDARAGRSPDRSFSPSATRRGRTTLATRGAAFPGSLQRRGAIRSRPRGAITADDAFRAAYTEH